MARDDFSRPTQLLLGKRVAMRCSNPDCRKPTSGPQEDSSKAVNIGVAAHISGAAEGGPRYDPSLTSEQRSSPDNGLWLCQNCGKLVDNDVGRYPVGLLRDWKVAAEKRAIAELEGGVVAEAPPVYPAEVTLAWRASKRTQERHDYVLSVVVIHMADEALDNYHVDVSFPRAVLPNHIFPAEVKSRSTDESVFFRVVSRRDFPDKAIFPGDPFTVIKIEYFLNHELFLKKGNLFDLLVSATLYVPGHQRITVERPFGDFQDF